MCIRDRHAAVDQATMEIDVSIETHAYLLLAKTQEHVGEAIVATHAAVDQATLVLTVKQDMDDCVFTSVTAVVYLTLIHGVQVIVIPM